jgi:hypothetical protein
MQTCKIRKDDQSIASSIDLDQCRFQKPRATFSDGSAAFRFPSHRQNGGQQNKLSGENLCLTVFCYSQSFSKALAIMNLHKFQQSEYFSPFGEISPISGSVPLFKV